MGLLGASMVHIATFCRSKVALRSTAMQSGYYKHHMVASHGTSLDSFHIPMTKLAL